MAFAARTSRRDRVAIAASIALHLCALAVLVGIARPWSPADDPDERTLLARLIQIERRPPPPDIVVTRVPAPLVVQPVPEIHAAVAHEHAARKLVVAPEHRADAVEPVVRASAAPRTLKALTAAADEAPAARPTAAPAPATATAPATPPIATPAPSAVVVARDDGIGNFGETYPASIDPAARSTLLSGVTGLVVRISVDENGHATAIEFVRAPADAALDQLRARLLAARFTPAACNGLPCAGTVTLRS